MASLERLSASKTGRDAAIDVERVSVHKRGCLAREKDGRADQFVDVAPAGCWRALLQPGRELCAVDQSLVKRRLEVTGRNGVDLQAVLGPIRTHAPGQALHRSLSGCVWSNPRPGEFALYRGDVDDLASPPVYHMPCDRLPD